MAFYHVLHVVKNVLGRFSIIKDLMQTLCI